MSIGNSMLSHQDRILGAQLVGTMNARRANQEGLPEHSADRSAKYRARRYAIQSEGLRAVLRRHFDKRSISVK